MVGKATLAGGDEGIVKSAKGPWIDTSRRSLRSILGAF